MAFLTPEQLKSNRDAARRVLELAGSVRIKIDGEISEVKDVKLSPVHPFSVVKISFHWGNKRLNDDALACVKGLSELKETQLGGAENIPGKEWFI